LTTHDIVYCFDTLMENVSIDIKFDKKKTYLL